jgi:hypothetical protein
MSTAEPKRSPERRLEGRRCLLVPYPCWRTTRYGDAPVSTTLRPSEVIDVTGEQKGLTANPAAQLVERGKTEVVWPHAPTPRGGALDRR